MKNILILGSLPKNEDDKILYNSIVEACSNLDVKVNSPLDTAKFKGTEKERYELAFKKVKEADLIIGEQSRPSTGQGMEIREAAILGKPLIIVAKEGSIVSGLVKGCPATKEILYYNNILELKMKLKKSIEKLCLI